VGDLNFFTNEILQDVIENRLYRILWIDGENKISYIIDLNDDNALSVKRIISEMREDILTGNVIKLKDDPFIVVSLDFILPFLKIAKVLDRDFDIMIEAKQKNLAMLKLIEEIASIRGIKRISSGEVQW